MKMKTVIFVAAILFIYSKAGLHRHFLDYYFKNVDDNLENITNTIQRYMEVHESHQIYTEDGYILEIFRIPRNVSRGVILFQHPVLFDARIWVSQYNESVAFLFWRAGYDVWLGNTRGNYFCKRHTNLTSRDREFWDFSFHEMGYYDNHATVQYIRKVTKGREIIYLGYSMGATSGLVYASTRSEEAANAVKLMIVIAPVTHLQRGTSIAKYIVPPFFWLQRTFNFVDLRQTVFGHDTWYMKALRFLFPDGNIFRQEYLIYFTSLIAGWTPDEVDPSLVNVTIKILGSEVPLKVADHFNQLYISGGSFRMYDYGNEKNLKLYGNGTSPLYPLGDIKIPVFIVCGQADSFTTIQDVDVLYEKLPAKSKIYGRLTADGLNHADFTIGRHRNERVYFKILKLLETMTIFNE